jgi:hypothetical protein
LQDAAIIPQQYLHFILRFTSICEEKCTPLAKIENTLPGAELAPGLF